MDKDHHWRVLVEVEQSLSLSQICQRLQGW